jgi:hypothetical protein
MLYVVKHRRIIQELPVQEPRSVAVRDTRTTYTDEDHEKVYQAYAAMDSPNVKFAAEVCGVSARTAEVWCAKEGWVQRRATEQLSQVVAIRQAVDARLLRYATRAADRAIELAMQDEDLPTAARMTTLVLGLVGYTPVTKSASVTMQVESGAAASMEGGGAPLSELIESFNARLAALGAPSPPQDIKNNERNNNTGGVPPQAGTDDRETESGFGVENFSDSPSSGEEEGGDVLEGEWVESSSPEE